MQRLAKNSSLISLFFTASVVYGQSPGVKEISIHNLRPTGSELQFSLSGADASLKNTVGRVLDEHVDPAVKRILKASPLQLLRRGIHTQHYEFQLNEFPLCQFELKAHETARGGRVLLGKIPSTPVYRDFQTEDWPLLYESVQLAISDGLETSGIHAPANLVSFERCIWLSEDEQYETVWNLVVEADRLQYKAIVGENRLIDFYPYHFHASATAQVYPANTNDDALQSYNLSNIKTNQSGQGILANDRFATKFLGTNDYIPLTAVADGDGSFTFTADPQDPSFSELSLFTNANRALEWFEERGYDNFGENAINISVHAVFANGDVNNALYQPAENSPTIFVGDGDRSILQNLSTDFDVVAHELGHHVVFHTVKTISSQSESLVIHEGLADFFTFAKTGNPCLGESICPASSPICTVPSQCLRTADNDFVYDGPDLPSQAHLRSQFISGMLWDMIEKDGIAADELASLVLKAVNILVTDSGYRHLVLAMVLVDEFENTGAHCSTIMNRAKARNLTSLISDISCDTVATLISENGGNLDNILPDDEQPANPAPSQKSSNKGGWCGSIGLSSSASLPLSLILLLPVGLLFTRKRNY